MKTALVVAAGLLLPFLGGCVVAPIEPAPVVYRPVPPPPPVVVVRPAYRPYYYGPRPYYRHWR